MVDGVPPLIITINEGPALAGLRHTSSCGVPRSLFGGAHHTDAFGRPSTYRELLSEGAAGNSREAISVAGAGRPRK